MFLRSLVWLATPARAARRSLSSRRVRAVSAGAVLVALCFARGASTQAQTAIVAVVGLTQGWITFGQVVPKGFAVDGLKVASLPTQTDVKTRWDDGSIRFAVVTVKAPAAGDYAVTAGPASLDTFVPQIPSASVTLTLGGQVFVAAVPAGESSDKWLSGPNVYEGRHIVTPTASGVPHPFLRVIFDTRVYNDRSSRVDVTVENVLNTTGATTVTYDVNVSIGGASVFSQNGVTHYYLTRWRKTFSAGSYATITPDLTAFNQARAIPPYLDIVHDHVDVGNATVDPKYGILQPGALLPDMSGHGGRPELAPYPDWTARYLAHRRPEQRAFVLTSGDLAGSWPVHVREPEDNAPAIAGVGSERFVSLNQRPDIWYDERAQSLGFGFIKGTPLPIKEYTFLCSEPVPTPQELSGGCRQRQPNTSPLIPDDAHQPSLAYVPYLLTGDRYYAEEMAFWANYSMLRTSPSDGVRGSSGILENTGEVRAIGWALRNIVDAAAYYPGAAVQTYLGDKVMANLAYLDQYAQRTLGPGNPLGILWAEYPYRPEPAFISLWEQSYLAFAIDRANKQGFAGGLVHRNAIAQLHLKLFTDPAYPLTSSRGCSPGVTSCVWSSPYLVSAGTVPDPNSWNGFQFHTTMSAVAANTVGNPNLQRDFAGFYGPEARMNLMIGIEQGWDGAQGAYDYLYPFIAVANEFCSKANGGVDAVDRPDLACRAGWAIDKYPPVPTPLPPPVNHAPVVNAIVNRSNTVGDSVTLMVQATDADGNTLTYSATGLPGGLSIDASSGAITGTLTAAGDFSVTVSASDGSLSGETSFSWHVVRLNHAPTVTIADQQNEQAETISLQVQASDPDGDTLIYSASGLPSTLTINATTGVISGVWTTTGDFPVTVNVFDGSVNASASFVWHVWRRAQILTPAPGTAFTSSQQLFTWDAGVGIAQTRIDIGTAIGAADILVGTFGTTQSLLATGLPVDGRTIWVRVSSLINGAVKFNDYSYTAFTFVNHSPVVLPVANQAGHVGDPVSLTIVATDADNDALTFTAVGLPNGTAIDSKTGVITGTLTTAGDFLVTVNVSDGADTRSVLFSWLVTPVNGAPAIAAIPNQSNTIGDVISVAVQATDPEHDALTYSATGLPGELSINATTGLISGTLTTAGDFAVIVTVSDGLHSASVSFQWHVAAPTGLLKELKNPGPQTSRAGDPVELQLQVVLNTGATSLPGNEGRSRRLLDFSATNLPAGLRISRETGTIRGHIDNDASGTSNVTVTVTEAGGRQLSQTFSWTVLPRLRRSGGDVR